MSAIIQPIRGTKDILDENAALHKHIICSAGMLANRYCYNKLTTPIFEHSAVFHRTLGETSDVVSKETYTFLDRDKTSITLRPEFTAAVMRALLSNGLAQSLPLKFFSHGPIFRHERPQHCRYRQFHQVNFEYFGPNDPGADVEMIMLAIDLLKRLKILDITKLEINTVGDAESRIAYSQALKGYLQGYIHDLSEDSQRRMLTNPLRILDSKNEKDKEILKDAPSILNYLTNSAAEHYEGVLKYLKQSGIDYTLNTNLVRGLDYYSHTVFEFTTDKLGSQGTVLAGGRYNGLAKLMGGPDISAIGFAAGIERLAELYKTTNPDLQKNKEFHIVPIGEEAELKALNLANLLRSNGLSAYIGYGMNLKKKMQYANKVGAVATILLGPEEMANNACQVKNMLTGEQHIVSEEILIEFLSKI